MKMRRSAKYICELRPSSFTCFFCKPHLANASKSIQKGQLEITSPFQYKRRTAKNLNEFRSPNVNCERLVLFSYS